jgi:hypothetical protein
MLTNQQVHTIRSRFKIFQSKTYLNACSQGVLSVAVESGVHDYIASWREQGSPWETWVGRYEVAHRGRQRLNKFFACEASRAKEVFESFGRHVEKLAQALLNRARELGMLAKTPAGSVGLLVVLQCRDSALLMQTLAQNGIVASKRFDGHNTLDDVNTVAEVLKKNVHFLAVAPASVASP